MIKGSNTQMLTKLLDMTRTVPGLLDRIKDTIAKVGKPAYIGYFTGGDITLHARHMQGLLARKGTSFFTVNDAEIEWFLVFDSCVRMHERRLAGFRTWCSNDSYFSSGRNINKGFFETGIDINRAILAAEEFLFDDGMVPCDSPGAREAVEHLTELLKLKTELVDDQSRVIVGKDRRIRELEREVGVISNDTPAMRAAEAKIGHLDAMLRAAEKKIDAYGREHAAFSDKIRKQEISIDDLVTCRNELNRDVAKITNEYGLAIEKRNGADAARDVAFKENTRLLAIIARYEGMLKDNNIDFSSPPKPSTVKVVDGHNQIRSINIKKTISVYGKHGLIREFLEQVPGAMERFVEFTTAFDKLGNTDSPVCDAAETTWLKALSVWCGARIMQNDGCKDIIYAWTTKRDNTDEVIKTKEDLLLNHYLI